MTRTAAARFADGRLAEAPLALAEVQGYAYEAALAGAALPDAAARLIEGNLDAAPAFDYRLPELWGGDAHTDTPAPVPYPAACRPQAWSAAAAIALMTALTGLDPDVPAGRVRLRPTGAPPVGALTVTGLTVAGERLDVAIGSDGRVESVSAPSGLVVERQAALRS